ncbi:MAG: signal peptide peptidase SppA [Bacteroidetes bacterium]|nr:signal peptide peptidase SppA [Bacteroidota bacterium]
MRNFLKIFLATFLAICVFTFIMFLLGIGIFSAATSDDVPEVKENTVLVIDISKPMMEQRVEQGLPIPGAQADDMLGLHDVIAAIDAAAKEPKIKGIYLVGANNALGFANSSELRHALLRFKQSKKFMYAYANYYEQRAYELAAVADFIYMNPAGSLDWQGFGVQLAFFKDALDKLGVAPEIFYAGQFKSATEPYRLTKMSEANRLQMTDMLQQLYSHFLQNIASSRPKADTAALRVLAHELGMQSAQDAVTAGLIDKLLYDDEVKEIIAKKTGAANIEKINFMAVKDFIEVALQAKEQPTDKIAVIFAEGEIVNGKSGDGTIGGETIRQLLRKARFDKNVKAVVLRINSPGGSALASEVIWREVELVKKEKPLVVSMGDYAASGGYFISCGADSIFAQPGTLTGSIGVYSMLFDASKLMSQKLGITFDEVSTAPAASMGTPFRSMSAVERRFFQNGVDSTYQQFLRKVANGRGMTIAAVDSVAQGRVWSGNTAITKGLADKIGTLQDAIACAARMAKTTSYSLRQWPEVETLWDKLFNEKKDQQTSMAITIQQQLGVEFTTAWKHIQLLKQQAGTPQMRLPFFVMPPANGK